MKVLETLAGAVIALISVLILMVGAALAFGSLGRYLKAKSM